MGASMRVISIVIFFLLSCSSVYAESDEFPEQIRGFWAVKKETCVALKKSGPAYVDDSPEWLKIGATDVLGSTQGRYFSEMPKKYIPPYGLLSFEIQTFGRFAEMMQLTLSRDGYLYESIVDKETWAKFRKC